MEQADAVRVRHGLFRTSKLELGLQTLELLLETLELDSERLNLLLQAAISEFLRLFDRLPTR